MPEKKLRLTRKEFRKDLPDTDKVFFVHGDEKVPAGRVGIVAPIPPPTLPAIHQRAPRG